MLRSLFLYLSEREFPKKVLLKSSLGRRVARRFIAGEELDEALNVVRQLRAQGFEVSLNYQGESVQEPAAAEEACQVYMQILDRLAAEGVRSHISIKLTQLGLALDEEIARRHLASIAERAAFHHNFVRIDMEGSAHTEATLRLLREVDAPRDALGVVIQAYLYRSEKDVEDLLSRGAPIRLVKGAYKEPAEVAFPRKKDVNQNYIRLMQKLLASGHYQAIATHDPHMIAAAKEFARARGLGPDRFEFQMIYGIRRRLQRQLLEEGFRLRIYVPYGRQWYPYFMRRLAERPANVLFLLKNLFRA